MSTDAYIFLAGIIGLGIGFLLTVYFDNRIIAKLKKTRDDLKARHIELQGRYDKAIIREEKLSAANARLAAKLHELSQRDAHITDELQKAKAACSDYEARLAYLEATTEDPYGALSRALDTARNRQRILQALRARLDSLIKYYDQQFFATKDRAYSHTRTALIQLHNYWQTYARSSSRDNPTNEGD